MDPRHTLPLHLRSWLLAALAVLSIAIAPGNVSAQSQAGEPSEEVRDLNDRAVRALFEEDFVRAISLLEESLVVREWNVTYLNLGRAYQLAGKCAKARAALERARSAPAVQKPRKEVVDEKADKYMEELRASCSEEELAGTPVVRPQSEEEAGETEEASVDDEAGGEDATDSAQLDEPAESDSGSAGRGRKTTGFILGGIGIVSAGAAVFTGMRAMSIEDDITTRAESGSPTPSDSITREEFESQQQLAGTMRTVSLSSAIASGVLVGAGLYFILSDSGESKSAVRLQAGPGSVGVTFTTPF